jgi:hypothetical protein
MWVELVRFDVQVVRRGSETCEIALDLTPLVVHDNYCDQHGGGGLARASVVLRSGSGEIERPALGAEYLVLHPAADTRGSTVDQGIAAV